MEKETAETQHSGRLLILFCLQFTPLLSNNQYTVRKMAAQAMMDVALMMANISQLRTLMSGGSVHITYFYLLLGLVVFSLVRCVRWSGKVSRSGSQGLLQQGHVAKVCGSKVMLPWSAVARSYSQGLR